MSDLAKKLAGRFIVLDGPDGSGKSTQLALLADWLTGQGVEVVTARDPGGTEIGDRIREIVLDKKKLGKWGMAPECEMLLFMASRAQLANEILLPELLSHKKCVLCDRWVSATIAYQGTIRAIATSILTVAEIATRSLDPQLTIILDVPPEIGLARARKVSEPDRMESKRLDFHREVRKSFLRQAADDPARFIVVDATKSSNDIQEEIRNIVANWNYRDLDAGGPPILRVLDSP